ncbi:MAG TPA: hypothetical protein VND87_02865 [Stellaceae bacterium]|nr:hypothetical protein [Stellaceae bacterium]
MNLSWIKPFGWGAATGAVVWWIALASVFGWTSSSTAQRQAARQSEEAVVAALAPVCAANFMAQPDASAKKATLANTTSWQRRDIFPEKWVTLPGATSPDSGLIAACSKLVLDDMPKTDAAS